MLSRANNVDGMKIATDLVRLIVFGVGYCPAVRPMAQQQVSAT